MDIQEAREAFERRQAKALNVPYEGLKARFDENSRLFGARYNAGSINEKEWNLWLEAWQAKSQAVPEWISMEDRYPKAGESVLICINGIRKNIAYFYDYSASDEYSTGHDWFEPVFTGGETEDECVVKTEDVTHWMLLPQEPAND